MVILDSKTGELVEDNIEPSTVYMDENMSLSMPSSNQIVAKNSRTGQLKWRFDLETIYLQQIPIVHGDYVVLKAGDLPLETEGRIWLIDKNSGEVIWKSSKDVGSNPAIIDNRLLFLTMDAQLHVVDTISGQELDSIKFSPSSLDDSRIIRKFHVVASNNIAVVYFGDSAQLFAFRF